MKRFILITIILSGCLFTSCSSDKTVFVDMTKVVYSYDGMKEAHLEYQALEEKFKEENFQYKLKLDSLKSAFEETKNEEIRNVYMQRFHYLTSKNNLNKQGQTDILAAKNNEFGIEVLNQIKAYTQVFAKENEFTYVLGMKDEGILYGAENLDVTEDLIVFLNKKYSDNK